MTEWLLVQERFKNSLFPVYFILEVMGKEMGNYISTPVRTAAMVNHGSHVQYWVKTKHWNETAESCFEKTRQDPKLIGKLLSQFRKKAPAFLKFVKKTAAADLTKKSNLELWQYYEKYCDYYKKLGVLGEPVPLLTKDHLALHLEEYFKTLAKQKGAEKKFADYFATLVSPTTPSFATREQQEFTQIAVIAQKKGIKSVQTQLQKHADRYFWLPYDYEGDIWNQKHFETTLHETISTHNVNLSEQLTKLQNQFKKLKQKQAAIIKELGIDKVHQALFQALRDCSEAMDYKKEIFTQSHWYKNNLMYEIGKRLGIPFLQTYFLTIDETKQALLDGKLDKKAIQERSTFCVSIMQNGTTKIEMGKNAKAWEQKLHQDLPKETNTNEIHGQCASPGSAIGKARVLLSASEISQMQEGEILVAQATTPDFVPAMKKAKAIITNEGGLTSHAAIVSRELGVPCIVGTKFATKQIKTGDLLDVHAASGVVKKISQSEKA